jgi:hypothetical protein
VKEASRYERADMSFLDVDEMESLSKAINYMTKLAQQWARKPRDDTEVIFSTKGDFQLGFYVRMRSRVRSPSQDVSQVPRHTSRWRLCGK